MKLHAFDKFTYIYWLYKPVIYMKFSSENFFPLSNKLKNLDLSYKTDLDFWNCLRREKKQLMTKEIWYSQTSTACRLL